MQNTYFLNKMLTLACVGQKKIPVEKATVEKKTKKVTK